MLQMCFAICLMAPTISTQRLHVVIAVVVVVFALGSRRRTCRCPMMIAGRLAEAARLAAKFDVLHSGT